MGKPLPLLAANIQQVKKVADLEFVPERLYKKFWPGPLTIVLPAKSALAPAAIDQNGRCAIRISSDPEANSLASYFDFPLTASSANISGEKPAGSINELSEVFFLGNTKCGLALWKNNSTASSPSTIVDAVKDCEGQWQLRILRSGVIDKGQLRRENFKIIE